MSASRHWYKGANMLTFDPLTTDHMKKASEIRDQVFVQGEHVDTATLAIWSCLKFDLFDVCDPIMTP